MHWLGAAFEYHFTREQDETTWKRPQLRLVPLAAVGQGLHTTPVGEPTESTSTSVPDGSVRSAIKERVECQVNTPASIQEVADDDVVEIPEPPRPSQVALSEPSREEQPEAAPVYLGSPQIVTFFSVKGGTGRTTMATELACTLAVRGWYRRAAHTRPERLNVALIDLDLGSSNISIRIGIGQPTIIDYLADPGAPFARVSDYLVRHEPTNVRALLGSPKSLAAVDSHPLGAAEFSRILSSLRSEGYQFIVIDIGPRIGELESLVLESADHIVCLVTPNAGSIQDHYRGVELLRRRGLGPKLSFLANKMREDCDLSIPLSDLGCKLVSQVPYDPIFDAAENRHQPCSLAARGDTQQGLLHLASTIYPGVHPSLSGPSFAPLTWFSRRRHAG
jgi:MinD-like ATPase involved in chromosome partitioning or flagellar assembly